MDSVYTPESLMFGDATISKEERTIESWTIWGVGSLIPQHRQKSNYNFWGAWVAQIGKHLTLDFTSGHNLRVMKLSHWWGLTLVMSRPKMVSILLLLPLYAHPHPTHVLSLCQEKKPNNYNFWLPKNIITNSLLLTRSLANNINSD